MVVSCGERPPSSSSKWIGGMQLYASGGVVLPHLIVNYLFTNNDSGTKCLRSADPRLSMHDLGEYSHAGYTGRERDATCRTGCEVHGHLQRLHHRNALLQRYQKHRAARW